MRAVRDRPQRQIIARRKRLDHVITESKSIEVRRLRELARNPRTCKSSLGPPSAERRASLLTHDPDRARLSCVVGDGQADFAAVQKELARIGIELSDSDEEPNGSGNHDKGGSGGGVGNAPKAGERDGGRCWVRAAAANELHQRRTTAAQTGGEWPTMPP